jgi:predicted dehydrogenase/threonine dehydrogenase-like Zn-dependent dehydrogenase
VKIRVKYSTVSTGTEISGIKESGKTPMRRAMENPKKILKAIDIAKSKGISATLQEIKALKEFIRDIGYSVSGIVVEVGKGVDEFKVGDRVSAGGAGFAVHAEFVVVPKNLVVKVPDNLELLKASTGTVGSIALHGVRRANLKIGEYAVVLGTGLLGLIAIQILIAAGVRVAAIDIDEQRLLLAKKVGAEITINSKNENIVSLVKNWTQGYGADAVLFFAATKSSKPLSQAFQMCRKKGKVVLVGVSGMEIDRNDIYKNEIDFLISSSYGPGRYDENYEINGIDYPYAFVRWTENRNISEYLRLLDTGKINLDILEPVVIKLKDLEKTYKELEKNNEKILTIIEYDENTEKSTEIINHNRKIIKTNKEIINVGIIGAGGFTVSTILPILYSYSKKFRLKTIVNRTPVKAINVANQFKIEKTSTKVENVLEDADINLVVITTRHNNHADLVLSALKNGKHVFVEKPLAVSKEQLLQIEDFYKMNDGSLPLLFVGFNRRFSKFITEIKKHTVNRISPLLIHYRMNAGFIPYDSWVHLDGGRIVGEACHIIDLMLYLTDSKVSSVSVNSIISPKGIFKEHDNKSISLVFDDGSVAILDYFSLGSKKLSKEYMEIHFDGKSIVMDNYKNLIGYDIPTKNITSNFPDKGHKEEWAEVYKAIRENRWAIPLNDLIHTTDISLMVNEL